MNSGTSSAKPGEISKTEVVTPYGKVVIYVDGTEVAVRCTDAYATCTPDDNDTIFLDPTAGRQPPSVHLQRRQRLVREISADVVAENAKLSP